MQKNSNNWNKKIQTVETKQKTQTLEIKNAQAIKIKNTQNTKKRPIEIKKKLTQLKLARCVDPDPVQHRNKTHLQNLSHFIANSPGWVSRTLRPAR